METKTLPDEAGGLSGLVSKTKVDTHTLEHHTSINTLFSISRKSPSSAVLSVVLATPPLLPPPAPPSLGSGATIGGGRPNFIIVAGFG